MIGATNLKNGVTFLANGKPYLVVKYNLIKMGRGGATVKITAKNLETGATEEKSFSSNDAFEEVNTTKKKLQFLYKDSYNGNFMDTSSFEQVEIPIKILSGQEAFLKEGENVNVVFWDDKPLSVEIAPSIVLRVTETDPGVKGNSATNIYKQAVLENGMSVKVPLFIKTGDKIKVDTRTAEYVERAK